MAKGFYTKNDPNQKLAEKNKSAQKSTTVAEEIKQTIQEPMPQTETSPIKRKAGRPKTKDIKNTCKNINVAVPITLLDKWEDIKIVHGSNLTEYITKLIEKDMNTNYEHYKDIADSLKNI